MIRARSAIVPSTAGAGGVAERVTGAAAETGGGTAAGRDACIAGTVGPGSFRCARPA